ncbi:MAG: L,D-transpeptidase [Bacteroidota bacterium]
MENDKIIIEDPQPEIEKRTRNKILPVLHSLLIVFVSILSVFFIIFFILYLVPALQEMVSDQKTEVTNNKKLKQDAAYKKKINLMAHEIERLSGKYNGYTTGQSYIVINTTDNKFSLYKNKKLIRGGHCSTGKLLNLKTEKGRSWVFKTPKGKRSIQGKRTNPAWHKPDWAFIEEGVPVPPKDSPLRWEANVLGDYALDIGDSYMIHGTIYKRLMGMPVTHGCVRLYDEDLEVVYNTLSIGSKVYIF